MKILRFIFLLWISMGIAAFFTSCSVTVGPDGKPVVSIDPVAAAEVAENLNQRIVRATK